MSSDRQDSGDYARPRRPELDTISYLRGLPLEVDQAREEVTSFLEKEGSSAEDFPQILAAAFSAIDEIKMEIASLAGDEYGSQGIELLAHISAPYSELASRILLNACSGYHLHLATHRYGSHVIQTILQLAVSSSSSDVDLAMHEEAPPFIDSVDSLPSLADLIQGMVEELSPQSSQLAIHVCGSHVLRTLLCVLGGVDLVSSPGGANEKRFDSGAILRGRKKSKKKKKKKKPEGNDSSSPHAGTMHIEYCKQSRVDTSEFADSLEALTFALLGPETSQPGELQELACHPSAGPLLIVLLRVLTYSSESGKKQWKELENDEKDTISDFRLGITRQEPTFEVGSSAYTMACRILCWVEGCETQPHAGDIIFGMSGELRGSHLLETLLRLAPDELHQGIIQCGDFASPTSLQNYVEHHVSNFVVQAMLTTIRTKEHAESMLKVVEKVIASGLAVDETKRRRGILWRAAELASKFRVGQDGILKAIRLGYAAVKATSEKNEAEDDNDQDDSKKKKKQRKKASAVEVKDCVKYILRVRKPEKEGDRVGLDAAGARTIYHMLRFSARLCEDVLKGCVDEHTPDELILIAKDGLGSRCIMDGLLDGPIKTPIFAGAAKSLYAKLKDNWVSLATDRVGHHAVKKLFAALPRIDDKAKLVEELVNGGNRLNGNTMGRNVAEVCLVNEYREDRKDWRKHVAKMISKSDESFLDEVIKPAGEGSEGKQKAKRKRKRKKSGKNTDEQDAEPSKKKSQHSIVANVDSIMEAMTAS